MRKTREELEKESLKRYGCACRDCVRVVRHRNATLNWIKRTGITEGDFVLVHRKPTSYEFNMGYSPLLIEPMVGFAYEVDLLDPEGYIRIGGQRYDVPYRALKILRTKKRKKTCSPKD